MSSAPEDVSQAKAATSMAVPITSMLAVLTMTICFEYHDG